MRYVLLACDYDGTIATHGIVPDPVVEGLQRVKASGRRLVLVSGRELDDLTRVFPQLSIFDAIVAENGAVLFRPEDNRTIVLAEPPPLQFVEALRQRNISPLSIGHVIVATWEPHEHAVLETIHQMGLELQVIFNKGAVMVLPAGVNKASGLQAALDMLGISYHNVVGVGDAENDHAFLSICECSVVVSNALPSLKARADLVTTRSHGDGVIELVERLLEDDLTSIDARLTRHDIPLGTRQNGQQVRLGTRVRGVLIAGPSGSGKSTVARGLLEQLLQRKFQFCMIDPEGDYENFEGVIALRGTDPTALIAEVLQVLSRPKQSAVISLRELRVSDRPDVFHALIPRLHELRVQRGRPHWILIDEAHHLLPAAHEHVLLSFPQESTGLVFITVHPDHLSEAALRHVELVMCVGKSPQGCLKPLYSATRGSDPAPEIAPVPGHVIAWHVGGSEPPYALKPVEPQTERRRHQRKYAEGQLGEDKSFYFRGPGDRLKLRAQNLMLFLQIAEGVDDETWLYHLRRGDYSRWLRDAIKDPELAKEVAAAESNAALDAKASREEVRSAISKRYTEPS